jgi:hypothetical protein
MFAIDQASGGLALALRAGVADYVVGRDDVRQRIGFGA